MWLRWIGLSEAVRPVSGSMGFVVKWIWTEKSRPSVDVEIVPGLTEHYRSGQCSDRRRSRGMEGGISTRTKAQGSVVH